MHCPHCSSPLRFGESIPPALVGAFAYVQCPQGRCGREMVAALHGTGSALMTFRQARREAPRMVKATASWEWVLAGVISALLLPAGVVLAYWESRAPGPSGPSVQALAVFAASGPALGLVLLGGFYVDELIARERWLAGLPRAKLVFAAEPEAYRA